MMATLRPPPCMQSLGILQGHATDAANLDIVRRIVPDALNPEMPTMTISRGHLRRET